MRLHDGMNLLGQVLVSRHPSPFEDVVDGLRAADDDVTRRMRRRAVARHALALEILELETEDSVHVVGGERGGNDLGQVLDDPLVRLLGVEHRRRRFGCHPARLPYDEPRRDRTRDADHQQRGDECHRSCS